MRHLWLDVCARFAAQVVALGQKLVKQQVELFPETARVRPQAPQPVAAAEELLLGVRGWTRTPTVVISRAEGSGFRGQSHRREHSGLSAVRGYRRQQIPRSRHVECGGSCFFFQPEVLTAT